MQVGSISIVPLREEKNGMVFSLRFFEERKGFTPREQQVVEINEVWLKHLVSAINVALEATGSSTPPPCGTSILLGAFEKDL